MRYVAVLLGGAVGALARWGVGITVSVPTSAFPWATFLANITGAFGLGFVGVLLTERLRTSTFLRPLLAIGFLGAYTTMSIMAVEGVQLIDAGHTTTALVYWISTLIAGVAAGLVGMRTGRMRVGLGRVT
jgi:fluoride exporter